MQGHELVKLVARLHECQVGFQLRHYGLTRELLVKQPVAASELLKEGRRC